MVKIEWLKYCKVNPYLESMNEDQFIGRIMLLIVNNINSNIFIYIFQNFLLQIKAINIYENNKKKMYIKNYINNPLPPRQVIGDGWRSTPEAGLGGASPPIGGAC